jgi:histidinol-phosphate aminotransferase
MVEPKKYLKELTRTPITPEDRIGKVHRLDRNERTTPFPKEHLQNILGSITVDEMVAYPEVEPFYHKLAKWLNIKREELLVASGSDTSIKMVFEVYVQEGDEVVVISPTYGMYVVYCKMFGATAKEVFYNADLSLPVERVIAAISPKTKLVTIANPNHTGTVIAQADLLKVIQAAGKVNALVLIDEAYYHFFPETMIGYVHQFDHLIIIRTFSKGFGIAPLRIGYTVSNPEIIKQLYKVKQTHDITVFSAKAGSYLLDHLEIMTDYVKEVDQAKEVLYKRLPRMGFEVLKSHANFVFFKCPASVDGKKLLADLEKKKIILKGPFNQIPFTGHLRVTVGSVEQMNMVCDEIEGCR